MQHSASYSITDFNMITFISQKFLQMHKKEKSKINDDPYSIFSKRMKLLLYKTGSYTF